MSFFNGPAELDPLNRDIKDLNCQVSYSDWKVSRVVRQYLQHGERERETLENETKISYTENSAVVEISLSVSQ